MSGKGVVALKWGVSTLDSRYEYQTGKESSMHHKFMTTGSMMTTF